MSLSETMTVYLLVSAVIYECMQTITSIYPHPALVDLAAKCVGRFLSATNINLRYIGELT